MTVLDEGRRARRVSSPAHASRGARWLASTLVALVLLGWAATVYILVLTATGLRESGSHVHWWAHVIAIIVIALTIEPLRRWLRPSVDDVVYGHLGDGYTVITELSRRMDVVPSTEAIGPDPSLARMIAWTLNVPYVAITDGEIETSAHGTRPDDRPLADVPLTYQGNEVGHLYATARHPGTTLSNRDLQLLSDLAQQIGVAQYALRASEQLQASRAALVTAREEERRRIRRDLHDGLGPTLASIKLQLTAVARLLEPEPARAADLLDEARKSMDETTADVRRLVYGLRPPLLDELGLVAALRNHPATQSGLHVIIEPEQLPELPAAVEVALYRIASEAIHNVARHSGGQQCRVRIDVTDDAVHMRVSDGGRGLPEHLVDGVGIAAMRERAAELGGTVEMASDDGTTVTTVIPLRSPGAS
jgi:signal transduction histidine kinase